MQRINEWDGAMTRSPQSYEKKETNGEANAVKVYVMSLCIADSVKSSSHPYNGSSSRKLLPE